MEKRVTITEDNFECDTTTWIIWWDDLWWDAVPLPQECLYLFCSIKWTAPEILYASFYDLECLNVISNHYLISTVVIWKKYSVIWAFQNLYYGCWLFLGEIIIITRCLWLDLMFQETHAISVILLTSSLQFKMWKCCSFFLPAWCL